MNTLGEKRVRVTFNPSDQTEVGKIKQYTADLINYLEALRNDEVSKTYEQSEEQLKYQSGEKLRLIDLAQTAYEKAAMWAVKAVTG